MGHGETRSKMLCDLLGLLAFGIRLEKFRGASKFLMPHPCCPSHTSPPPVGAEILKLSTGRVVQLWPMSWLQHYQGNHIRYTPWSVKLSVPYDVEAPSSALYARASLIFVAQKFYRTRGAKRNDHRQRDGRRRDAAAVQKGQNFVKTVGAGRHKFGMEKNRGVELDPPSPFDYVGVGIQNPCLSVVI
ncbi:unnamed protein product [Scytosiphon promiscuus]